VIEFLKAALSVLIVLGAGLPFGYLGKPTEMGLGILAGAIAATFINIDKIQRVKGGSFEAEMRMVVNEAYATIESLRQLAKPLIRSAMYNITRGNRLGQTPDEESVITAELESLASELKIIDDGLVRGTLISIVSFSPGIGLLIFSGHFQETSEVNCKSFFPSRTTLLLSALMLKHFQTSTAIYFNQKTESGWLPTFAVERLRL